MNTVHVPPPPIPPQAREESWTKTIKVDMASLWIYLAAQTGLSTILSLIVMIVLGVFSVFLSYHTYWVTYEAASNLVILIVAVLSGMLAIVYAGNKFKYPVFDQLKNTKYKKTDLFCGVLLCYGFSVPLSMLVSLLSMLLERLGLYLPATGNSTNIFWQSELIYFIAVVIAAPLLEELIFRGILMGSLKKYSPAFALVFSALCFGLMHMNLYQGISVFGMGLAMGFMYLKSGSLQVPVFMHMVNNLIAMIAGWVPDSMGFLLDGLLMILMLGGWIYFGVSLKDWKRIFAHDPSQAALWKITVRQVSFWLLAAVFIVMSVLAILGIA